MRASLYKVVPHWHKLLSSARNSQTLYQLADSTFALRERYFTELAAVIRESTMSRIKSYAGIRNPSGKKG